MKKSEREEQKTEALVRLQALCPAGSTVYTVLVNRSRSGMSRTIKFVVVTAECMGEEMCQPVGHAVDVSWWVGRLLGYKESQDGNGLVVRGAGMDMGFHVVYSLSRSLFPKGHPCDGEDCNSNDHVNGHRDRTPGNRVHRDGGYCLKQSWL